MATETCKLCEAVVPYSEAVHLTIHTKSEAGVVDGYLCPDCYNEALSGVFDSEPAELS